ncbi:MAG: damage-inducible protein CinA [Candidatus Rokuibacteriota bacterium]|nr:MAG: damage-inducible protein CinA [Candidatus Rokubacteria bacterium]
MTASAHIVTVGAMPSAGADGAIVAAALGAAGVAVVSRVFVEDDEGALEGALGSDEALTVVLAGGGGSAGDIVRRVLARVTGTRLVLNERVLATLQERYRRLDRPLPRRAERLALLPQGATVWMTADGEAGWALESAQRVFAVLARDAGVQVMIEQHLTPFARAWASGRGAAVVRTLRTAGLSPADVEERLVDWLGREGEVAVSTIPADGEVWVRLRARASTPAEAARSLAKAETAIGTILGDDCYGRDGDTLELVVGRMLLERRLTLAVAESCTGGLLGHRLTNVPGSSAYFERGVLVYSNRSKEELLGVPDSVLRTHGAVSAPCAEAMARGVATLTSAPCALAVTGIAGPDGGTPTKPVGTVFVGLAVRGETLARRFHFAGDRAAVKWQSTQTALDMLRRSLRGQP